MATLEAPDGSLLEVADDRAAAYEAKGYKRTASFGGESLVTSKATGQVVQGDAAALPTFREATNEDVANYEAQREFGGEKGRAFLEGVARTATFGLSDIAAQALGADERGMRERRERTGGAAVAGELAGALLPGGAAGIAGKAGGAVTKAIAREGAGLAGRVGARAAGTAAEGSLFGFGQGVSELALSEEPVTAERAFKVLGSNTVLGGAIGGGFGGAGALLGEAAKAGKAALAERMAARAERKVAGEAAGAVPEDLAKIESRGDLIKLRNAERERLGLQDSAKLDELRAGKKAAKTDLAAEREALKAEREAELAALATKRVEDGRAVAADIKTSLKQPKDYFLAVSDDGQRKVLAGAESNVRRLGDNIEALAERPIKALDAYQQKSQALREFLAADAARVAEDVVADRAALLSRLPVFEEGGKTLARIMGNDARAYRSWRGIKATKGQRGVVVSPADVAEFRAAIESGEFASMRLKGVEAARTGLAESDAMVTRLRALLAKPSSERLTKIDEALSSPLTSGKIDAADDALSSFTKAESQRLKDIDAAIDTFAERNAKAPGHELVSGLAQAAAGALLSSTGLGMLAFPIASKVGDAAAAALSGGLKKLFGKLSDQAAASQQSISKALDVFVSSGARVSKAAAIKTSASLAGARYAPPSLVEASAVGQRPSGRSRGPDVDNYRARERELLAMTTRGPDGKIMMRPAGANHVFEALAPIRMVAPKAADNLAAQAQRRVEFLAGKLPPRPDRTGLQFGEDDWQPSDMELRKFARYVDAVEGGPEVIAERVSTGQLTPEDAETLREVYPETYREIQAGLIDRLSTVRRMPYAKRLMLGVLFDVATDDSLNPEFIAGMQSRFPAEEGTEGGMQAPSSKLGSVTNPAPTAAQRLST